MPNITIDIEGSEYTFINELAQKHNVTPEAIVGALITREMCINEAESHNVRVGDMFWRAGKIPSLELILETLRS